MTWTVKKQTPAGITNVGGPYVGKGPAMQAAKKCAWQEPNTTFFCESPTGRVAGAYHYVR